MKNLIRRMFRARDRVQVRPLPYRAAPRFVAPKTSLLARRLGLYAKRSVALAATVYVLGACFGLLTSTQGCTPSALQTQRVMASTISITANSVLPILLAEYRREILATVDESPTREAAEAAHAQVVERWRPIWGRCEANVPSYTCTGGAWKRLSSAHDAWSLALENEASGGHADAAVNARLGNELKDALCALYAAVPATTREELRPLVGARCDSSGGQ
jgi:hypothetical protein